MEGTSVPAPAMGPVHVLLGVQVLESCVTGRGIRIRMYSGEHVQYTDVASSTVAVMPDCVRCPVHLPTDRPTDLPNLAVRRISLFPSSLLLLVLATILGIHHAPMRLCG
jgi:hypothetical protein